MISTDVRARWLWLGVVGLGLAIAGCEAEQAGPPQGPPPTPEVAYITTKTESVVLNTELPGRTAAFLVAEVRPQVTGIIEERLFEEGQDVNKGDVLYRIEPARYEAAYRRAVASLAMAKAELPSVQARVDRSKGAVEERAVSRQAYDDAVGALEQLMATIAAREADVKAAKIDLDYTNIVAPISGRIGRSNVTVGALATANQPQALATIHQYDPVYVDVMQSSVELLRLRRDLETGELHANSDQKVVRLRLEDGTEYPLEGVLKFRDIAVKETTGAYTLRIQFPNPDRLLLPGMFVRGIVQDGVLNDAVLVPQQGVLRTPKGEPYVLLVKADNTVEQRMLKLSRAIGDKWLVDAGLATDERVIVEGLMNVRPGMTVRAVPFGAPSASQPTGDAGHAGKPE